MYATSLVLIEVVFEKWKITYTSDQFFSKCFSLMLPKKKYICGIKKENRFNCTVIV